MALRRHIVFPKQMRILEVFGENLKLARKRRKLTIIQMSERAGIDRGTLREVERGNPRVSLGAYMNVLSVMNLQDDFLKIGIDDVLGRKLQDLSTLKNSKNGNGK